MITSLIVWPHLHGNTILNVTDNRKLRHDRKTRQTHADSTPHYKYEKFGKKHTGLSRLWRDRAARRPLARLSVFPDTGGKRNAEQSVDISASKLIYHYVNSKYGSSVNMTYVMCLCVCSKYGVVSVMNMARFVPLGEQGREAIGDVPGTRRSQHRHRDIVTRSDVTHGSQKVVNWCDSTIQFCSMSILLSRQRRIQEIPKGGTSRNRGSTCVGAATYPPPPPPPQIISRISPTLFFGCPSIFFLLRR